MPIGAFISSAEIMSKLTNNPILGHITTFGGHPVCCVAGLATLNVLLADKLMEDVLEKEGLFRSLLVHPKIRSIQGKGLLLSVEFESFDQNKLVIDKCIANGVITDWFLFNSNSMRIAPPLIITPEEIKLACSIILKSLE
jgi:acetylornithine/succinyldiaminopimelate/putrescine aminotransferase